MTSARKAHIEAMCGSNRIIHLHGTLVSNLPDCNGLQIPVERIGVEE